MGAWLSNHQKGSSTLVSSEMLIRIYPFLGICFDHLAPAAECLPMGRPVRVYALCVNVCAVQYKRWGKVNPSWSIAQGCTRANTHNNSGSVTAWGMRSWCVSIVFFGPRDLKWLEKNGMNDFGLFSCFKMKTWQETGWRVESRYHFIY